MRSSRSFAEHDRKYQLGFTENEKRVNTTFSRAAALLVVVGDPYVLVADPLWSQFLSYTQALNCYDGPELSEDYIAARKQEEQLRQARIQQEIATEEQRHKENQIRAIQQQQVIRILTIRLNRKYSRSVSSTTRHSQPKAPSRTPPVQSPPQLTLLHLLGLVETGPSQIR